MNILVLSWRDIKHPLAGGAEKVAFKHMKFWVDNGHNVTLFSSKTKKSKIEENIEGIKIIRKGYQYLGVQLAAFFYYKKNKKNIDFIVEEFHGIPFFTTLYSRKPKIAVIYEVARNVWFMNPFVFPIKQIIGLVGFVFEPFVFIFYKKTKFVTISNSTKKDLVKFGINSKNIEIIYCGFTPKKLKKFIKEKVKTITFLGVLSKDKGIEDALKVFKELNNFDHYQFWILGKGEEKYVEKLKKFCAKNKIDNVKFWGFVDEDKKYELLGRSHVLINTSFREGWGLVNIEANSVGVPVVAYDAKGIVDSVVDKENGIIIKKRNHQKMAKTINNLLQDESLYKKYSKNSFLWSKNFPWEKSLNKSLAILDKLSHS